MTALDTLREEYQSHQEKALEEFFTFLKFQSVSSESEYKQQVNACADWVESYLKQIGFETEQWETSGHPCIFGSWMGAGSDQPTLLIYNHYDVQPVDPLEDWVSPPFEPEIRDGEIYARGAQDNKGQCFYVLQALKLLMERDGRLPINIKICIEGEEETGSAGLYELLEKRPEEFKSDYLAIVDVGIQNLSQPAVTLGVRGMLTMDVSLTGSKTDLHSGSHGGVVFNPIHALVEVLSKVRDSDGKITIPGFYDDVEELSEEDRHQLSLKFDPEDYEAQFGKPTGGEKGFAPLERAWIRPTFEVNGISGGYSGKGFKTVIPAKAHAKVSCRLVPNQDPRKMGKLVADFLTSHAPEGVKIEVDVHAGQGAAVRANIQSPVVQAFSNAYSEVFGKKCGFILEGGSIPIVKEMSRVGGSEVVLMGMGLPGDQIHAPNEHFGVARLELGFLTIARALENLRK